MNHPDSRYCRTCGHDFNRLYDEPIQCDACCGAERQVALMQPEIDRLRADRTRHQRAVFAALWFLAGEAESDVQDAFSRARADPHERRMAAERASEKAEESRVLRVAARALEDGAARARRLEAFHG